MLHILAFMKIQKTELLKWTEHVRFNKQSTIMSSSDLEECSLSPEKCKGWLGTWYRIAAKVFVFTTKLRDNELDQCHLRKRHLQTPLTNKELLLTPQFYTTGWWTSGNADWARNSHCSQQQKLVRRCRGFVRVATSANEHESCLILKAPRALYASNCTWPPRSNNDSFSRKLQCPPLYSANPSTARESNLAKPHKVDNWTKWG